MRGNLVTNVFRCSEDRRFGRALKTFYVVRVKGDGGVDWEWTEDPKRAVLVSFYWARRFMADRRACGVTSAQAVEFPREP